MQCINCESGAKWMFSAPGSYDRPYCERHVPDAYRGLPELAPIPVPTPPPADEAPADEAPKPKPKARRKADPSE